MNKNTDFISIKALIILLYKRIVPILLCTVICALTAFVYYAFFVPQKYTATVSIIVDNRSYDENIPAEEISHVKSTSDITASRMLADTYVAIFRTSAFLEQVCDRVNDSSEIIRDGKVSPLNGNMIDPMLTMSAVNATEVLQIKATSTVPQLSVDICYAIVEEAENVLRKTMNTLTVNSVEGDNILIPTTPSSPSAFSKAQLGALIGFFGSCIVIVGIYLLKKQLFGIESAEAEAFKFAPKVAPHKAPAPMEDGEADFRSAYNNPSAVNEQVFRPKDTASVKMRRNLKPGRQAPSQRQ